MKADIKHYFETVSHNILIKIIRRRIKDEKVIWLTKQILDNLDSETEGAGMPLGNYTSQFFANIYLNDLDYFVKTKLKARYYIRYVDDFVILHSDKKILEIYKEKISKYLKNLELELHPDKTKILPLRNGISFLGYRIFYHFKLLRKGNFKKFKRKFEDYLGLFDDEILSEKEITNFLKGWCGYSMWANTYKLRKELFLRIESSENISTEKK